jgi:hypothetical protein
LEELQAAQQKGSAALAQTQQDVLAVKAQAQNVAAVCADTRTQVMQLSFQKIKHIFLIKTHIDPVTMYIQGAKNVCTPFRRHFI